MQKKHIRLELDGEDAINFEKVKQSKGLKNNAELVRLLINDAYKELLATAN